MRRPLIALLTDFGLEDTYVGVMKGVMKSIAPDVEFIDLTHQIRPGATAEAAHLLATSTPFLPDGTTCLCVVDPGVGSSRAALAVAAEPLRFVAPDNGLLSLVWRQAKHPEAHVIISPDHRLPDVSSTFHGRDVFAPAAAHLANGVALSALGPRIPEIELLALEDPHLEAPGRLRGAVIHVDHFGNLITNVRTSDVPRDADTAALSMLLGKTTLRGLVTTYSSVSQGEALIHWGSSGHLEVAVRGGSAAERLGAGVGAPLHVTW